MRRSYRRWSVIPVVVLALLACGDEPPPPTELPLSDLVRFEQRYQGERVATSGLVQTFPEPRHYWIEDAATNRIRIVPQLAVSDRVGERVRVVGWFAYDSTRGRVIEAEQVEPLE